MTDRENESGVALISVLCLLTLFALLVGTLVAMSQTLRLSSATSDQLAKSVYRTESAANRALWLLIQDRRTFINRTVTSNADQLIVRERFRADGAAHTFEVDGMPVELIITDMNRGLSLTGYNPAAAFNVFAGYFERRPKERTDLDVLRARLMDYVDSDDLLRRDGLEFADYDELKKHPLPRNTPMQYPEEALWIPGAEKFLIPDGNGELPDLTPIPPRGLQFNAGTPNAFSVSPEFIRRAGDFSEDEVSRVFMALQRVRKGELSVEDAFAREPILLEKLKRKVSFNESSCYTFKVGMAPDSGIPSRHLVFSVRIGQTIPDNGIQFIEWKIK